MAATTDEVWREVEKNVFAVLGMVTSEGKARTVGIVYVVRDRQLYIATYKKAWKTRHIEQNGNVSLTVTIPKRVPFLPWIRIPAATITFPGKASVHEYADVAADVIRDLHRGMKVDDEFAARSCIIRVEPKGYFVTYGVGVPLLTMRDPERAKGRVPVR
jgi:hypothetical protein